MRLQRPVWRVGSFVFVRPRTLFDGFAELRLGECRDVIGNHLRGPKRTLLRSPLESHASWQAGGLYRGGITTRALSARSSP